MARINIEEKWWGDPRRQAICDAAGDAYKIDGVFLHIIKCAQEYIKDNSPIPEKIFSSFPFSTLFIEHGLCELSENGVWIDDHKRHIGWLAKRVEAGRKGGKITSNAKRAAAKLRESKVSEIINESDHKQNQASAKQNQANQANHNPHSHSHSHSHSQTHAQATFEKQGRAPSNELLEANRDYPNEYFSIHEILKSRNVPENLTKVWLNTYPDAEWVVGEVKKATAWEASNPRNKKIHFGAYLTNWMNRCWDKRPMQKQHSADTRETGNRDALDKFKKNLGEKK